MGSALPPCTRCRGRTMRREGGSGRACPWGHGAGGGAIAPQSFPHKTRPRETEISPLWVFNAPVITRRFSRPLDSGRSLMSHSQADTLPDPEVLRAAMEPLFGDLRAFMDRRIAEVSAEVSASVQLLGMSEENLASQISSVHERIAGMISAPQPGNRLATGHPRATNHGSLVRQHSREFAHRSPLPLLRVGPGPKSRPRRTGSADGIAPAGRNPGRVRLNPQT